jgi:hypothetical protein
MRMPQVRDLMLEWSSTKLDLSHPETMKINLIKKNKPIKLPNNGVTKNDEKIGNYTISEVDMRKAYQNY